MKTDPRTPEEIYLTRKINDFFKKHDLPYSVRKSRSILEEANVGRYYLLNTYHGIIEDTHVDPNHLIQNMSKFFN